MKRQHKHFSYLYLEVKRNRKFKKNFAKKSYEAKLIAILATSLTKKIFVHRLFYRNLEHRTPRFSGDKNDFI